MESESDIPPESESGNENQLIVVPTRRRSPTFLILCPSEPLGAALRATATG